MIGACVAAVWLAATSAVPAAAAPEDYKALPDAVREEVLRVEEGAKRSAEFRRLLAENDGLERKAGALPAPQFVRFETGPRRLAYDEKRLSRATEWELQLAEARELARASMDLPVTLVEAEAAARQRELVFALELAQVEPAFSQAWAKLGAKAQAAAGAAARLDEWTRARAPDLPYEPAPDVPEREFEKLALYSGLLAQSPARFYDAVGAMLPASLEPCRLAEVEDFTTLHARELLHASVPDGETFVLVGRSRYPARVVRAAKRLAQVGGAEFAREAIGPADDEAAALSVRLRHQLRWPVGKSP